MHPLPGRATQPEGRVLVHDPEYTSAGHNMVAKYLSLAALPLIQNTQEKLGHNVYLPLLVAKLPKYGKNYRLKTLV